MKLLDKRLMENYTRSSFQHLNSAMSFSIIKNKTIRHCVSRYKAIQRVSWPMIFLPKKLNLNLIKSVELVFHSQELYVEETS